MNITIITSFVAAIVAAAAAWKKKSRIRFIAAPRQNPRSAPEGRCQGAYNSPNGNRH